MFSSKFCRQNVLRARLTGFACFQGEKRERDSRSADGSAATRADRAGTVDEAGRLRVIVFLFCFFPPSDFRLMDALTAQTERAAAV